MALVIRRMTPLTFRIREKRLGLRVVGAGASIPQILGIEFSTTAAFSP